jgi:Domain of unknown function (DUF588)
MMADELGKVTQKVMSTREKDQGEEMNHSSSTVRTMETLLRMAPMGLCVAALVVMLKNSQNNDFGNLSYSDLGAFRYICFQFSLYVYL